VFVLVYGPCVPGSAVADASKMPTESCEDLPDGVEYVNCALNCA
jgi:hypothetical protein